jgi:hypothetical protein
MVARGVFSFIGLMAVLLFSAPFAFAEGEQEAEVRAAFADAPAMISIARCESKFTQFGKGGTALHGGYGGKMVGIFQVYSDIHAAYAKSLGMDIYTTEGNIAYARYLYQTEGTKPWLSSFPCWGDDVGTPEHTAEVVPASAPAASGILTVDLSLGRVHPQVVTLQKLLNTNGFALASEGPGSLGNETEKYGSLTRDAVRRFQCSKSIVCSGDEYSTGYGFVGARTRAALSNLTASAATTPETSSPVVSGTEDPEITRLKEQIAELTRVLNGLLATSAL